MIIDIVFVTAVSYFITMYLGALSLASFIGKVALLAPLVIAGLISQIKAEG